ncbi:MAG: gamma-glutamylcyclotransferase [Alcanivoracaceae bacterium]|nr:gamma-glutamylcyclotransferase [Alcanivoracaceae bacterium]
MATLVFVYGTLMRGERNHHWMRGARFVGGAVTAARFSLWSLGAYPVICPKGRTRVRGEVFRLSYAHLRRLDILEEYPRFYHRCREPTRFGPAWIYYQSNPPLQSRLLPGGNWRRRTMRPLSRSGFAGVEAVQGRLRDLC